MLLLLLLPAELSHLPPLLLLLLVSARWSHLRALLLLLLLLVPVAVEACGREDPSGGPGLPGGSAWPALGL